MEDVLKGLCHFQNDQKLALRINLLIAEWEMAYPNVNIREQLKWAHAWLVTHPERPKKLLARFLNNWMQSNEKRFQERRQSERRAPQKYVEHRPAEEEVMTDEDWKKLRENIRK